MGIGLARAAVEPGYLTALGGLGPGGTSVGWFDRTPGKSSGVTSKPAIEGHFKTGQRTNTLDDLFYLTDWQSGKSRCSRPLIVRTRRQRQAAFL